MAIHINKNNIYGFTLIEVVAVMVIIGILVAIAVPVYKATTAGTEFAACLANQYAIENAAIQWSKEDNSRSIYDADDLTALNGYFQGGAPVCPSGAGDYTITDGVVTCPNGHTHY